MDKLKDISTTNCSETQIPSSEYFEEKQEIKSTIDSNNEDSLKSNSSTSSSLKSCSPSEDAVSKDLNNEHSESSEHLLNTEDQNYDTFSMPEKAIPPFNVPEKIVLCIDTVKDNNDASFKMDDEPISSLIMIKRIIEIFLYNKLYTNKEHQFALVLLQTDNVIWLKDFTSNPQEILHQLHDLNEMDHSDMFDLSLLFNVIKQHVSVPHVTDPHKDVPPYILRVILLYNRSNSIPKFITGRDSFNTLNASIYFTVDILYIHEEDSEDNRCKEIFQCLNELDIHGDSYILDVTKNTTTLHDNMAKLLAHPLQRPSQKMSFYKIPEIRAP